MPYTHSATVFSHWSSTELDRSRVPVSAAGVLFRAAYGLLPGGHAGGKFRIGGERLLDLVGRAEAVDGLQDGVFAVAIGHWGQVGRQQGTAEPDVLAAHSDGKLGALGQRGAG